MERQSKRVERVWLIRHGQTEYNLHPRALRLSAEGFNRIVRESEESRLTPEGHGQIERLAGHYQDRPLQAVHSSPLPRALQSAGIISDSLELPIVCIDGFREFVPTEAKPLFFPDRDRTLRCWFLHSMSRQFIPLFPVSESIWQARARVKKAWRELLAWTPPDGGSGSTERLVAVHRGTVLIMLWALWWDRQWTVVSSDVSNGGITEIIRK